MQADGEVLELAVGENKKRADAENYMHTAVGLEGGKALLNVEARRHEGALLRHAHTSADLRKFSPMGPHLQPAKMAGVFSLRQTLPSVQVRVVVPPGRVVVQWRASVAPA